MKYTNSNFTNKENQERIEASLTTVLYPSFSLTGIKPMLPNTSVIHHSNMLRQLTTLLLLWGFRCFKDLILQCECWVRRGYVRLLFMCEGWGGGGANNILLLLLPPQHSFSSDSGHTSTHTHRRHKQTSRHTKCCSAKWACGQQVQKQTHGSSAHTSLIHKASWLSGDKWAKSPQSSKKVHK